VAAAKAWVAQLEQRPTSIGRTDKITKPIPTGEHIAFIGCGNPSCDQEGQVVQQAAKTLDWSVTVINTDGTPGTEKAAFDQAVREKVAGIVYTSVDASTFASDVPALKANGTFVTACCVTDPVSPTTGIDYSIDTVAQTPIKGKAMAAWVSADSNGHADTVWVDVPAFSILKVFENGFIAGMKQYCPGCQVNNLDIPVTALGNGATTQIVSYLRANPNVKYVISSIDDLNIGLPAALRAAGLSDVKIGGEGPVATNIQYIRSGQQSFTLAFAYYEDLYAQVDAIARHVAGVPVPPSTTPPMWLITQSNAPEPPTSAFIPIVTDVQAQYEALWGK
jgi:ABC-type sugar transport system substrate-binding protein